MDVNSDNSATPQLSFRVPREGEFKAAFTAWVHSKPFVTPAMVKDELTPILLDLFKIECR
jgi:hypothetical protein